MKRISYLFLLTTLLFGSLEIYAQWVWQNPKPTGNDILNVKFTDESTGWFVGNCGTIFKTTDGGKNWSPQLTDYTCDFTAVDAVDYNNIWVVGCGYSTSDISNDPSFKILNSTDGGKNWNLKLNGATFNCDSICRKFGYVEDVDFIDPFTGFVVGDSGMVLKTIDGGSNWTLIQHDKKYQFKSVQFFDSLVGYISGGSGVITIGHYPKYIDFPYDGIIIKTTDGGTTWNTVFSDTIMIYDIFFRNRQLGWAIGRSDWLASEGVLGHREFILKTSNAGQTWVTQVNADSISSILMNIFFADDNNGWVVGTAGIAMKTNNGGDNWTMMCPAYYYLADVFCFDSLHVFAVGKDHAIIETTDGGYTWVHRDTSFLRSLAISSIYFFNSDTGMFSMGSLYRTTDKGNTWQDKGITGLWKITGHGEKDCWGVGSSGKIIYSSDAGNTWMNQTSGLSEYLWDVKFVSNKIGWAISSVNILNTTDGGAHWVIQNTQPGAAYQAIITQDFLRAWVYAAQGSSVKTVDGGISWDASGSYWGIYFVNPDTGWIRDRDTLYRTFDGGKTLEKIGQRTVSYWKTQFVDGNNGWSYDYNAISLTHNGGYTWWPGFRENVYQSIESAYFIDSIHGWAGTMAGGLIRYGYPELITSVPINNSPTYQPSEFQLCQNYPNPFNLYTTINYQIKSRSYITIRIYDIIGKEVKLLENSDKNIGSYKIYWDGRNDEGKEIASGVYVCILSVLPSHQVKTNSLFQMKKMILIK